MRIRGICTALITLWSLALVAAPPELKPGHARYIVMFKKGASAPDVKALGGNVEASNLWGMTVTIPEAALDGLSHNPNVKYIQKTMTGPLPIDASMVSTASAGPRLVTTNAREVTPNVSAPTWSSGNYAYDGSGNITQIGPNAEGEFSNYLYDSASRLKWATMSRSSVTRNESYVYDGFGNMTERYEGSSRTIIPVVTATNRLDAPYTYDEAGDLTGGGDTYAWDPLNMMRQKDYSGLGREYYVYTPSDERIGVQVAGYSWVWSIRDFDGKVLRQYQSDPNNAAMAWVWIEDYVWRGGQIAGAERVSAEGGRRFFHVDHLGSPRLITASGGQQFSLHDYAPYGNEITSMLQDPHRGYDREEPINFTGHERDFTFFGDENSSYLDYMHARYTNPNLGRFLSVDRAMNVSKNVPEPQRWNRYSYVSENPITYFDPDGLERRIFLLSFHTPDEMNLQSILDYTVANSEGPVGEAYNSGYSLDARHSLGGKSLLLGLHDVDNSGTDIVVINSHGGSPLQTDTGGGPSGARRFSFGANEIASNLGGRPQAIILAGCGTMDSAKSVANATNTIVFGVKHGAETYANETARAGTVLANVYAATGNAKFAISVANNMLKHRVCPKNGGTCSEAPEFEYVKPNTK